jgi:hypothetical protein
MQPNRGSQGSVHLLFQRCVLACLSVTCSMTLDLSLSLLGWLSLGLAVAIQLSTGVSFWPREASRVNPQQEIYAADYQPVNVSTCCCASPTTSSSCSHLCVGTHSDNNSQPGTLSKLNSSCQISLKQIQLWRPTVQATCTPSHAQHRQCATLLEWNRDGLTQ